ncbi:MAG: tRNA guanosine(34) transglycosylase Tgt [Anaerolineae bacterium]|nr:tRNA guanosine(34) transglycosylase Tgt [Anaerolineae bacterium]NIN96913.1 tRNA guanosine(34) transglycosylase Tgt [Anaerolineae bacterium]NIQ79878.1 tRNA guanosine(34) transglycosylase Tgt [Anaerolineae bacterium]
MEFSFDLERKCRHTWARVGLLQTPHGEVRTPVFAPVGTQATVKTVSPRELEELGVSLVVVNTYHLYLRPGTEVVAKVGGLHSFMGWHGPILTDSGGFQVFSMKHLRKLDDDGVTFRSHVDGSEHRLTPEKSVALQEQLGADIIIALDVCPPYPSDHEHNRIALDRTHRWAERCLEAQTRTDQMLLGVVQGGTYADLRAEGARHVSSLGFPGYAIGGLSVGEPKEIMHEMLDITIPLLPEDKPRHLLGVGSPEDLFESIARGIDIFDCALPTRVARNGTFLTREGRINIRNAEYRDDPSPVERECACYACRQFSRAYLRHLVMAKEILGLHLATLHNLHFMLGLVNEIREAILQDRFPELKEQFLSSYKAVDYEVRLRDREVWLSRLRASEGVSGD